MNLDLDFIVSQTRAKRRGDGQWMGSCPGHADKNASLSITKKDGRVLLYCSGSDSFSGR
jgi:DNA primase